MGKQLFIANTALIATNKDLTSGDVNFTPGSLAFSLASAPTTSINASELTRGDLKFQVWGKKKNNSAIVNVSPLLTLNELVSYRLQQDNAGTAQVTTLTVTVPETQLIGDSYRLTIANSTPGTANITKRTYTVTKTTITNYTTETLTKAFEDIINADSLAGNLPFLAAYSSGTAPSANNVADLVITGKVGYHFRLAYDGESEGTIVYTTDMVPATGTYAQTLALEEQFKTHGEGITNKTLYPVKSYTSNVSSTGTYDLGVFHFRLQKPAKHAMGSVNYEDYYLYLAELTGLNSSAYNLIKTAADLLNKSVA